MSLLLLKIVSWEWVKNVWVPYVKWLSSASGGQGTKLTFNRYLLSADLLVSTCLPQCYSFLSHSHRNGGWEHTRWTTWLRCWMLPGSAVLNLSAWKPLLELLFTRKALSLLSFLLLSRWHTTFRSEILMTYPLRSDGRTSSVQCNRSIPAFS